MTDPESDLPPLQPDVFGDRTEEESGRPPRRRSPAYLGGESTVKPIGNEPTFEPSGDEETYSLAGSTPSTHAPIEPPRKTVASHESAMVESQPTDEPERRPRRRGKRSRLAGLASQSILFLATGSLFVLGLSANRLLADDLGRSPTVWTAVACVMLVGVAVGGLVGGRLVGVVAPRRVLPGLSLAASVGCVLVLVLDETVSGWDRGELSAEAWSAFVAASLLLLPAALLGAHFPAAAALALRRTQDEEATLGDLFACSALGGVAGAASTGFLLIDHLGTRGSIWLVAGTLAVAAVVAAAGMRAFRTLVVVGWMQFLAVLGLVVCATPDTLGTLGQGIGVVLSHREEAEPAAARQRRWNEQFTRVGRSLRELGLTLALRDDRETHLDESDLASIRVRTADGGRRTLEIDGVTRGRWDPGQPDVLSRPFDRLAADVVGKQVEQQDADEATRILFLGGGSFALPRWCEERFPRSRIEVVEPDPAVVDVSRRYFDLPPVPGRRSQLTVEDPRTFVSRRARPAVGRGEGAVRHDLVVLDLFEGRLPPAHLTTREFAEEMRAILVDDGAYVVHTGDRLARTVFPQPTEDGQPTFKGRVPPELTGADLQPGEWTACPAPFEGLEVVNLGTRVQPAYAFAVLGAMSGSLRTALEEVGDGNPLFREAVAKLAAESRRPRQGRLLAAMATTLAEVFPYVAVVEIGDSSTYAIVAANKAAVPFDPGDPDVRVVGSIVNDPTDDGRASRGSWENVVGIVDGFVLTDDFCPVHALAD